MDRLEYVARVWVRAFMVVLAIGVVMAALVACSASAHHPVLGSAAPACPSRGARPGWVAGSAAASGLVPPGAVSLVECSYPGIVIRDKKKVPFSGPVRGPLVDDPDAVSGYIALLGQEPPISASCWHQAVDAGSGGAQGSDLLLFGYPDGRIWVLDFGGAHCDGVAGPGGAGIRPDDPTTELLDGLGSYGAVGPTHPAPDLVGLTLQDAARRDHGLTVVGEIVDSTVTEPTIAVTDRPAGAPIDGSQTDVVVAVAPAPPCRASQLRTTLTGGEPGAGTAFASLFVRDAAKRACTLRGPIMLSALDSHDRAIASTTVSVQGTGTAPLVLSPQRVDPGRRVASSLTARALLSSTDFAGNCATSSRPSGWRVMLASRAVSMDSDREVHSRFAVIVCNGSIYSGPFTEPGRFVQ